MFALALLKLGRLTHHAESYAQRVLLAVHCKTLRTCVHRTYSVKLEKVQPKPTSTSPPRLPEIKSLVPPVSEVGDDVHDLIVFIRPANKIIELKSSDEFVFNGHNYTSMLLPLALQKATAKEKVVDPSQKDEVPSANNGETNKLTLVNAIKPQDMQWTEQILDVKKLPQSYMKLSKIRLTGLVVLTSVGGYFMAPGVFDPLIFVNAIIGTGLTSCAANTLNQYLEVPFDSQMNRTKNRLIIRGAISPLHAVTFAAVSSTVGVASLWFGVNGLTAALGALNLVLYSFIYTPMKRYSIANTWVGSIVGAVPPIMGWTACTGSLDAGALVLAGLLFAWQFPHFNALSWNLRGDYSRAGYRMMSVTAPNLCRKTTLRYSVAMMALCTLAPLADVTTWAFAIDSLPVNAYMVYLAWRFYQNPDSTSSRKLFKASLLYLPLIMMLMFLSKKKPNEKKTVDSIPIQVV